MAKYIVNYTSINNAPITVSEGMMDTTSTDVALFGHTRLEYGELLNEDLLHLLEHFACPELSGNPGNPDLAKAYENLLAGPIEGQFWYNTSNKLMYYWDKVQLKWIELRLVNDVAAKYGVMGHDGNLPHPVSLITGTQFAYDECIWAVAPAKYDNKTYQMQCSTDNNARVTMLYSMSPSLPPTVAGIVNYLIIGIRGNQDIGAIKASPTPTPTQTPIPSPTPTPSVTMEPTPTPTMTPTLTPAETPLIIDSGTIINIYFDGSGSMNDTLPALTYMRDDILKTALSPLFNPYDPVIAEALYYQNVTITSISGSLNPWWERTWGWMYNAPNTGGLLPFGHQILYDPSDPLSGDDVTKEIFLIFQDEAQTGYHSSYDLFSSYTDGPTGLHRTDVGNLRTALADMLTTRDRTYYRGVVFAVDSPGFSGAFQKYVRATLDNSGLYSTTAWGLSDYNDMVELREDIVPGRGDFYKADDQYYFANEIIDALNDMGFNLPNIVP